MNRILVRVLMSDAVTLPFFLKTHQLYLGEVPVHLWAVSFSWEWLWVLLWLGISRLPGRFWRLTVTVAGLMIMVVFLANHAGYLLFGMFLKNGHLHMSSPGDMAQAGAAFLTPDLLKRLAFFHGGSLLCHGLICGLWRIVPKRRQVAAGIGAVYLLLTIPFAPIRYEEQRMSLTITTASFFRSEGALPVIVEEPFPRQELEDFAFKPPAPIPGLPEHKPYHLIIYPMESVRASACSSYGSLAQTTPFLDRVRDQGIFFERFYSNAVRSIKALTTITLGIYPYHSRSAWSSLPINLALQDQHLAGILKRHRYFTTFFVNSHISFDNRETYLRRLGYDRFEGSQEFISADDSVLVDKLDHFFRDADARNQPLLSLLLPSSGHAPYPFNNEAIPLKTAFKEAKRVGAQTPGRLHAYLNAVHHQDQVAEKIYEYLRRTGRLDHTIFVVVGDHGEAFGEHGALGGIGLHGASIYEESIHVPAWIHHPDLEPRRVTEPVQFLDMLPTCLAMLGLPVEDTFLGRNVLVETRPRLFLMNHVKRHVTGMLAGDHKLIAYGQPEDPDRFFQLFDVTKDPFERHPLPQAHPQFTVLQQALDRAEQVVPAIQQGYRARMRQSHASVPQQLPAWDKRILGNRYALPTGHYLLPHLPKPAGEFQLRLGVSQQGSLPVTMAVTYRDQTGRTLTTDTLRFPAETLEPMVLPSDDAVYAQLILPRYARAVVELQSDHHTAPYIAQRTYGQATVYSGKVADAVAGALVVVNPSDTYQELRITLRGDDQVIQTEQRTIAPGHQELIQVKLKDLNIASITIESDREPGVVSWLLRWRASGFSFR